MTAIEAYLAGPHNRLSPEERGNFMWRRLACDQIAETEISRSLGYQMTSLEYPDQALRLQTADRQLIAGLMQEIGKNDMHEQLLFALSEPLVHTSTLSSISMRAVWDEDKHSSDVLKKAPDVLCDYGYKSLLFDRESPKTKKQIAVVAGILPGFPQMVAIRRKRHTLVTNEQTHTHRLYGGESVEMQTSVELDKISWFALDIAELDNIAEAAAREVRLIVLCSMINDPHPGDEDIIISKMNEYGFTREEIEARLQGDESTVVKEDITHQFIESAIRTQSPLLAPAVTTHLYEKKLHSFKIL